MNIGRSQRAGAAFTLVELLVVMGIIGVLVCLLMPAAARVARVARTSATRSTIVALSVGLERFKADWGEYPPSRNSKRIGFRCGCSDKDRCKCSGTKLLATALPGPEGKGWGRAGVEDVPDTDPMFYLPFGGAARRQFGPYYQSELGSEKTIFDSLPRTGGLGTIFYYRFNRHGTSVSGLTGDFRHDDNPAATNVEEFRRGVGFAGQDHFLLSVKYEDMNRRERWMRDDYLLISSGPDRIYGQVYFDPKNPDVVRVPTAGEKRKGMVVCDDITNF